MNNVGNMIRYIYCHIPVRKPLENNKIVFMSYMGKKYACNPMYICEYLLKHYPGKYRIVWAFNFPEEFEFLKDRGIETVEAQSRSHIDHLLTAKVIITNNEVYGYLPRIKGQAVINTWHAGGAYKTVGFNRDRNIRSLLTRIKLKKLYSRINLFVSSSFIFTEFNIKKSRDYRGEILPAGMPRNDIFFGTSDPEIKERVKNYFKIDSDTRIILYAPTLRDNISEDDGYDPGESLNFDNIVAVCKKKFGGENWVVLYRQHYWTQDSLGIMKATNYPDMQELLYAADILITDYSSSIWDYSFTKRPAFLYCPDFYRYENNRGFFIPIDKWPAVGYSKDEKGLIELIEDYDESNYRRKLQDYWKESGSYETGNATRKICERIEKICFC